LVTVAELESFVLARWRRQKGRRRGQALRHQDDVGFDGGIAAGIDDLAGVDFDDLSGHGCLFSWVECESIIFTEECHGSHRGTEK